MGLFVTISKISKTESELEKTSGNASELNAKRDEYREKSEKINLELVTLAKDNEAAKLSVEELNFRKNSQFDRVKTIEDEIRMQWWNMRSSVKTAW